ncbi:MAG: peptidylprolyl isomerase [Planctomycetota bacterium]
MTDNANMQAVLDTSEGSMTIEFFPEKAPNHVQNFIELAQKGFYNGTIFHRVIAGFMIQGGCPDGTGRGGPGHHVKAEFNDTHHERGVVSMARAADPDSAGSQFFICHGDASFLNGQYTAFGRLVAGDDTLDKIANAPVAAGAGGENSSPLNPVRVNSVAIVERGA